jgi:hypothetical protein
VDASGTGERAREGCGASVTLSHTSRVHSPPLQTTFPQIAESFSIDPSALMDAQAKYQTDPDIEELMKTVRMHFFGEEQ